MCAARLCARKRALMLAAAQARAVGRREPDEPPAHARADAPSSPLATRLHVAVEPVTPPHREAQRRADAALVAELTFALASDGGSGEAAPRTRSPSHVT